MLKFLHEVLRNEAGRLRQDAQSMNGFLLWKASEKWTSGLLKTLFEQSLALDKRAVEFLLKVLGLASKVLLSCLEGGYINFAICEYYNDRSYTEFLLQYCTCIVCIPQECVLSYQKPCERIVRCLCTLFLRQLPMIITTLDTTLLSQLFFGVLLPALREASEARSLLIQTLDNFCEATYDQVIIQRQAFTRADLAVRAKLEELYNNHSEIFEVMLSVLVTQLFFEDVSDDVIDSWSTRLLHSSLLVYGVARNPEFASQAKTRVLSVIETVIRKYEKDQIRQTRLANSVSGFLARVLVFDDPTDVMKPG